MNEWSLTAAAIVGLASVGALTGLAAFGQAGSDAAKIIPIAGGFVTGVTAWFDNKRRAKDYTLAADRIDEALKKARSNVVGGTDEKFMEATGPLYDGIYDAEIELEKKRKIEALAEERLKAAEDKLKDTERKLKGVIKFLEERGMTAPGETPNQ